MGLEQVNVTGNQSTAKITLDHIFLFDNRFEAGSYLNNTGGTVILKPFSLVARNAGSFEKATFVFNSSSLTAGQTMIIAGLTYTSTGTTTQAELAAAFANLADGAVSGNGLATGTYSGALTGYSTGAVIDSTTIIFTSSVTGDVTDLVATGTGAAPGITIVNGTAAVADGLIPITSANLADTIGISANEDDISQLAAASDNIQYATKGDVAEDLIIFPGGVTLDTVVGNKVLRDILEDIGFHLVKSVDNTKQDNV